MWVEVAMSDYFIHFLFKRLILPKVLSLPVILLLFGTLDFAIFDIFGMKKKNVFNHSGFAYTCSLESQFVLRLTNVKVADC